MESKSYYGKLKSRLALGWAAVRDLAHPFEQEGVVALSMPHGLVDGTGEVSFVVDDQMRGVHDLGGAEGVDALDEVVVLGC